MRARQALRVLIASCILHGAPGLGVRSAMAAAMAASAVPPAVGTPGLGTAGAGLSQPLTNPGSPSGFAPAGIQTSGVLPSLSLPLPQARAPLAGTGASPVEGTLSPALAAVQAPALPLAPAAVRPAPSATQALPTSPAVPQAQALPARRPAVHPVRSLGAEARPASVEGVSARQALSKAAESGRPLREGAGEAAGLEAGRVFDGAGRRAAAVEARIVAPRAPVSPIRSPRAALRPSLQEGPTQRNYRPVPKPGTPGAERPAIVPMGTDPATAKFLRALKSMAEPGDSFDRLAVENAAEDARLADYQVRSALSRMAQAGLLLSLSNGRHIYTDLGDAERWGALSGPEQEVRERALGALSRLNGSRLLDAAQGFAELDGLDQEYVADRPEADGSLRQQVRVLHQNAGLELMSRLLAEYEGRLSSPSLLERETLRTAKEYLRKAYFSKGRLPAPLDEESRALFRGMLDRLKIGSELGDSKADPDALQAGAGVEALRPFLDRLAAMEAPAATGDQAREDARAEFPLVDERTYPSLHKYGTNLSRLAVKGKLSPLVGRRKEIRQGVKALLRLKKNNPVFIGEKGVGKTQVVEGLAQMIVDGEIPQLEGVNIIRLDVGALIAGTTLRGQFEERLKAVLDEAKKSEGGVLLFIDELHNLMGLGSGSVERSADGANLVKEALSTGDVKLIGATTLAEYRKIEKDGALERRFQPVTLEPPSLDEAIRILEGVKRLYEERHGVTIPSDTVEAAARLAQRYIKARFLPDSALDLMDDAAAEVQLRAEEARERGEEPVLEVSPEDIAVEVNLRTGIPAHQLTEDDRGALARLAGDLEKRVIGQSEAVRAVVKAIQRGRLGYKEEKQPVGVFVFLGPTGVGKTELVRALAANQYGSADSVIRLDMSEFMEKHAVSRLISAPPGYVGYGDGGQLTEPVRRKPYSLVLFDEIEKAAPEVLDILLQVIEDGRLTDGQGRTVDFSNTIVVMTSNIGGSLGVTRRGKLGFAREYDGGSAAEGKAEAVDKDGYLNAFRDKVRPEFYNRIGKRRVIVFNRLGRAEIEKILDLRMADLRARIAGKGLDLRLSPAARAALIDEAASAENLPYGARPVKQAVEHEVEDALVEAELAGRLRDGDKVLVDYDPASKKYTAAAQRRARKNG